MELYDGESIEDDLAAMGDEDRDLLDAFLQELADSERAMTTLMRRDASYYDPRFNVKAIESLIKRGFNVSRVRPLTPRLSKYRILFTFDATVDEFHLLAIVKKRPEHPPPGESDRYWYEYELDHWITQRVLQEYERNNFSKIS